ncbi:U-box domain-containing protein 35-like [Canna indica]|uniref:U-box domain-containing protein 35-like n=1 Tax=Canna indica TaxID=4628 RepID=A0AAQ3JY07_9LILI|nr:U-box domain-containing protein 35-like [Canna indica]
MATEVDSDSTGVVVSQLFGMEEEEEEYKKKKKQEKGDISHNLGRPLIAVAIDKEKNSKHAVRWAVDHLLINTNSIALIHVRTRQDPLNRSLATIETSSELSKEQVDDEIAQLFHPYRGFCARKGLLLMEVVLEDFDISKAIIDYIIANNIHAIIVGSSSRYALRKFMYQDVPSYLLKNAPDFCGVYVICKGKPLTIRTARTPVPAYPLPSKQSLALDSSYQPAEEQLDYSIRNNSPCCRNSERPPYYMNAATDERLLPTTKTSSDSAEYIDVVDSSLRSSRMDLQDSLCADVDFPESMDSLSMNFGDSLEPGIAESPPATNSQAVSSHKLSLQDAEPEMRRLRLELKQMKEMFNAACREAIMAKEMAREWHKMRMEEAQKVQELRHLKEAALELVEIEKAKCKAALEAAEAAKRIAELEAKRRYNAELRAKREAKERKKAEESLLLSEVRYRKYTIDEIEVATKFFSKELKIGEGGYGPVFRALLDHTPVAIKVLSPDAAQGRQQFQQEVEILSNIRHPNMVLLLGACPEYGCLIYEYMDYGSLEDRLFRKGNTPPIPWPTRFKIAAEIATGLLFLHQAKPEPLVHRDLKPANILLDHNYVSKISDVGLARLVPQSVVDNVTQYRITTTAGTLSYIDPEYQQTGMLGVKSDVYSLGIILLQIITAMKPMGLTHHVESAIEKGTFANVLDPCITDWPMEEVLSYAKLALKCAELRRKDRPNLGRVILPELNRLRSFGQAYEAARWKTNNSDHVSVMHEQQVSDSVVSAPYSFSNDGY